MSIVITGATGQLGRHVVEALLQRNVPAAEIVAAGRSVEKLADFAARGVQVRAMDYTDATSVAQVLKGGSKVLLVSGNEVGARVDQHRTVIEAAKAQGVELLAYTSVANADTTAMKLAADHQATEAILKDSGSRSPSSATAGTSKTTPTNCRARSPRAHSPERRRRQSQCRGPGGLR
ncbi:quinone oxidoreductase 2 [Arthrobacter sp. Hiyo4]|nr:quinone oxidoreductase 2 [Arthrobacter sp. Hiyo4]